MGFNGNYSGYSIDSVDVFIWVLITAGAIIFPAVVFTVCFLKQRWRIQKLEQEYLYADPSKKKDLERGFLGPYAESKENLDDRSRTNSNRIPEIIIQPFNNNLNNKVRFKDEYSGSQNVPQLPNLENQQNQDNENIDTNNTDLRGLKNAVNFFGKNLANNKKQNFSNRSVNSGNNQQQALPQLNTYTQNPLQQNQDASADPVVYSVANSYPQTGIQGTISQSNNLVPDNIYSQVVSQNRQFNQPEESNYSNSQNGFYDDEQPVYMNTPYTNNDNNFNDQYELDYNGQPLRKDSAF